MKDLQTLLAELKQLPAAIGYILGWTGDILAVLTVIGSAIFRLLATRLSRRSRSQISNQSPLTISTKREFPKYSPETFGKNSEF
jgi:hypothetical protein